jgi:hypothetical protein
LHGDHLYDHDIPIFNRISAFISAGSPTEIVSMAGLHCEINKSRNIESAPYRFLRDVALSEIHDQDDSTGQLGWFVISML